MVKKSRRSPFNSKPQTIEKYEQTLNAPSDLLSTALTPDGMTSAIGTATPKEDDSQNATDKPKRKKGRRLKDRNSMSGFFGHPLFWVTVSVVVWAVTTNFSLNRIENKIGVLEENFSKFSNDVAGKLSVIQQYFKDAFVPTEDMSERAPKEYNVFNFSKKSDN